MQAYLTKIEYVLPKKVEENPVGRRTNKTGIFRRHICEEEETASDLAFYAAEKLFKAGVDKQDIDFLILCTQSPDYYLPTTACILQDRLGLPKHCGAFDYNLGCSGFVYGLAIAKGLIETRLAKNVLLITAETYSKHIDERDNSVLPVFGDAAAASLVTGFDETNEKGLEGFVFGTDGSGYDKLIVPVGGMRERYQNTKIEEYKDQYNNIRTNRNLYMDGMAIGNFGFDVVPDTVEQILEQTKLTRKDINYFVFHQANSLMLKFLQEKCKLEGFPYWNDIKDCGNTVSASIPIAIKRIKELDKERKINTLLTVGFGVGLSWGGCLLRMHHYKN